MATITYTAKGMQKSNRGTAKKDGVEYEMRELQSQWKLVTTSGAAKIEFEWSKKDLPSFTDWCDELNKNGYEILIAD